MYNVANRGFAPAAALEMPSLEIRLLSEDELSAINGGELTLGCLLVCAVVMTVAGVVTGIVVSSLLK